MTLGGQFGRCSCGRVTMRSSSTSVFCSECGKTYLLPAPLGGGICPACYCRLATARAEREAATTPPPPKPGGVLFSTWSEEQERLRREFEVQEAADRERLGR